MHGENLKLILLLCLTAILIELIIKTQWYGRHSTWVLLFLQKCH